MLPIVVIVGATLATAVVWTYTPKESRKQIDLDELEERLRQLDERLSNVETISRYDRILAEKTAASNQGNTGPSSASRENVTGP